MLSCPPLPPAVASSRVSDHPLLKLGDTRPSATPGVSTCARDREKKGDASGMWPTHYEVDPSVAVDDIVPEGVWHLANDHSRALLPEDAPLFGLGTVGSSLLPVEEAKDASGAFGLPAVVGDARCVRREGGVLPGQLGPAAAAVERDLDAAGRAFHPYAARGSCAAHPRAAVGVVGDVVGVRVGVGREGRRPAAAVAFLVRAGRPTLGRLWAAVLRLLRRRRGRMRGRRLVRPVGRFGSR